MLQRREEEFSDKLNHRASFSGFTALMYAVLIGNTTILEMLLENGADPSIENEVGLKARDYANNYPQMIKLLQEYEGKVINYTNRPIFVPLFKVYFKIKNTIRVA